MGSARAGVPSTPQYVKDVLVFAMRCLLLVDQPYVHTYKHTYMQTYMHACMVQEFRAACHASKDDSSPGNIHEQLKNACGYVSLLS